MTTSMRLLGIAAGMLLLAAVGCSDHGTDPIVGVGGDTANVVSFTNDVQPILTSNCLPCHGVGGNGRLDLRNGVAWGNLVAVESWGYAPQLRVIAGDMNNSVLFRKLIGDPSVGARMPLGSTLDISTVDLLGLWIAQGALDN